MEAGLINLTVTKRLPIDFPAISTFFILNLISFLLVSTAGIVKLKSNVYSLARLPFLMAMLICLVYQLPLVVFSHLVESSLSDPWHYAFAVNSAGILLLSWTFATRRFDTVQGYAVYPESTNVFHLITGVIGFALICIYITAIPWKCTGLFALLFDPQYTLLARELGIKLIGTSLQTYAIGAYAGAVAPIFLLLSIWQIENHIFSNKIWAATVCVVLGFIALVILFVTGIKGLLLPSTLMMAAAIFFTKELGLRA